MTIKQAITRLHNLQSIEEFDLCTFIGMWYQGIKVDYDEAIDMAIKALTAQPERKKGEWIHKPDIYLDEQTWECSECGEPWIFIVGTPSENNANFCPNCGADMRGEQYETD